MFELFLFINPIGIYCFDVEQKVQRVAQQLQLDVRVHYVLLVDVSIMTDDICRRRCEAQKIAEPIRYTQIASQALHYFHAIKLAYGNKRAREFLLNLQTILKCDAGCYNDDLPKHIAEHLHLNWTTISDLLGSADIQESIIKDQQIARQWHVESAPTSVIFNDDNDEGGIMLEGRIPYEDLLDLMRPDPEPYLAMTYPRLV